MAYAAPSKNLPDSGPGLQPDPVPESHCEVALAALADAHAAIARDDIEGRCNAVARATEAVTALFLDVDIRTGGRMIETAARQYRALLAGLVRINLRHDAAAVREVRTLLEPLRGAWAPVRNRPEAAEHLQYVR